MITDDRRVRIISGHYGSGKTEFAVNYAIKLAELGKTPVLADIDIINPYFRSREKEVELEKLGVKLIAGSIKASSIDVPAISAGVYSVFDNHNIDAVVDSGGDNAGMTVLKRFSDHFSNHDEYDLFFVINARRPETRKVSDVLNYINSFERTCGLKVSGLINNTHMLKSTTVEDVIAGWKLSTEVSEFTGIPLKYSSGMKTLEKDLPQEIRADFFPVDLYMRDDWMS